MKAPILHDYHVTFGARMTDFAGWSVPLTYGSMLAEAKAVRSHAGLFDVSHMGRVVVEGPNASKLLQRLTTNDVSRLQPGKGQYTLMCNANGGVVDDLIVFHVLDDSYLLVVNAANREKDLAWLRANLSERVTATDLTDDTCLFALQGPKAREALEAASENAPALSRFGCGEIEIAGVRCFFSRTGYTGEDGYEFECVNAVATRIWEALRFAGQPNSPTPCGLGARDVLRIEAGYVLYGQEIGDEINPMEAGLSRFVSLDKGDFVGREAILAIRERGTERVLTGVRMDDRSVPREGAAMQSGGATIGHITSGTFSPTIERGIGLGYIDAGKGITGAEVKVLLREKPCAGRLVTPPFYTSRGSG